MYSDFSGILESLIDKAGKASAKLSNEGLQSQTPVILHPRVWQTEDEAIKASTDSDYRVRMETIKQLEQQLGDI